MPVVSARRRQRRAPSSRSHRARSPNRLLRALSAGDYAALLPHLRRVTMSAGHPISEPRRPLQHVYFPETAVLSLIVVMADGAAVEAATVGNEGVAGVSAFLGAGGMTTKCLVQIAGDAQRMTVAALLRAVSARPTIAVTLRRYAQAFVDQLSQSVACNTFHNIHQRCARWLLMTHDRVTRDEFMLTQEFLSQMLGVRRARVNVAAGILQRAGLIRYSRGRIRLADRAGLEAAACECYSVVRAEYDRLASGPVRPAGEGR